MEEVKQKSWFGRNWVWVVPLGGCLTIIALFVLGIGALVFGVSKNAPQNNKTDIDKAIATNTFLSIFSLSINLVLIGDKIKIGAAT